MKLTTKRNRWYFWRELFSYMIPMILIVGTIDVFYHFMQCSLHSAEMSAPCDVNRILAAAYWIILFLVIILAIISAKVLRRVKKKIENEFFLSIKSKELFETMNDKKKISDKDAKKTVRSSNKKNWIIELIEKNKNEEDGFEGWEKVSAKKTRKRTVESDKKSKRKKVSKK